MTISSYHKLIRKHKILILKMPAFLYVDHTRIVVSGEIGSYIPISSVGVFQFDTEYGLTFEECLEVSDHYPVELQVAGECKDLDFHTFTINSLPQLVIY